MTEHSQLLLVLAPGDDVAVARRDIVKGSEVAFEGGILLARDDIPSGHKIALKAVSQGDSLIKYGQVIGQTLAAIAPGDHVHVHNLDMPTASSDYSVQNTYVATTYAAETAYFDGFVRPDGRVGTRNYIGILSSVNCSATVIKRIAAHFTPERLAAYPHVDGVAAFA